MCGKVIIVVVGGIICLVDYDWVFLKASDAPTAMDSYAPNYTSDFFRIYAHFRRPRSNLHDPLYA